MDQSGMDLVHQHRLAIGIFTDVIAFLGGAVLAWDAFYRVRDLKNKRITDEFGNTFRKLNMTDKEWEDAQKSVWRAVAGTGLLVLGLICQILLRFAE